MCYDADAPKVCATRTILGRRPHDCYECGARIAAGMPHELTKGLWDGCWAQFRVCASCVSLRDVVTEHERAAACGGYEATPPFGEVWTAALEAGVVSAWPREEES